MHFSKFYYIILFVLFSCKKEISLKRFTNYNQVENYLSTNSFKVDETTDTGNSSFITSAHFQSEDGEKGFLTLGMKRKEYHFSNVPIEVWERFKNANSKGKFYHRNIKGKYSIKLK
ncbi:KTSC domain-containing protein [Kaistella flava (ex Peng et al. 2021)]|uniref:KTSC domain-containing protein n=1 Tax=Kaistella flava (ex Peng et al. 2021) TaxID=2038776 RepID=A0A7M2YAS4_9FLAO|nr:KTSC domain-containing protein [Kaistella flava (ex Peng et al. 2021)]QOW11378.1 KTSC domain-containing protein [Kaistella flava (ex Peng et al. 2021)]